MHTIVWVKGNQIDYYLDGVFLASSTGWANGWDTSTAVSLGRWGTAFGQSNIRLASIYDRILPTWQIEELAINPDLPMQEEPVWWGQAVDGVTIPRMIHHYKQAGGL